MGFDYRQEKDIFLFSTVSRSALRPTQPPIPWVPGALSPGQSGAVREADYSPSCSVEANNDVAVQGKLYNIIMILSISARHCDFIFKNTRLSAVFTVSASLPAVIHTFVAVSL
jgi:hypothetical protein